MGGSTLSVILVILIVNHRIGVTSSSYEGLSYDYYDETCPQVEDIVRTATTSVFALDSTSPSAILRLMFHDCQVQGCDASILIDLPNSYSSASKQLEMGASKNFGVRNRETINSIKLKVESECPKQVSCADILVLAAREAIATSGGPNIRVPLGRRDSFSASTSESADASLPSSDIGVEDTLRLFAKLGMSTEETVAIMGAHTLGVTHCLNIVHRLYNPSIGKAADWDPKFQVMLELACPKWMTLSNNISFVSNDPSAFIFDNWYYQNAIAGRGVLRVDAELASALETKWIVQRYAASRDDFFKAFSSAFIKLSYAGVLTGNQGVIRSRCDVA